MKDFFGADLAVGDQVAFIEKSYRSLQMGAIVAFTAQKVRLRYPSKFRRIASEETLRFPSEIVKG